MPINTSTNNTPYFDDFDPIKDYYRVMFKPGVAIQTRELTQLQSILQHQTELFGDNIYKRGTIIDGCNFIFYPNYPYIKIIDNDINGIPINVQGYLGYNVKDSSNVVALIVNEIPGFEATDPDLNTLYLRYLNSGTTGSIGTFISGEVVTIYDGNNVVEDVEILNGSSGFTNSDSMVFCSAIAITNTSSGLIFANGTGGSNCFNVGDTINYVSSSANVRALIVEVNATSNAAALILKIEPITTDLQNVLTSAADWTFPSVVTAHELITNTAFVVVDTVGAGASATTLTDSFGSIINIPMTNRGAGYYVAPFTTLKSATGSYANLNLVALNYLDKVQISAVTNSIGVGYAFGVTAGVIYQKGFFLRVTPLIVVVDKYANTPDAVVVGFDTKESFANSNFDPTLLDNATGTPNFAAPGADRLQLTPELVVFNKSDADSNALFFSIVEWSNGNPFKQNRVTAFNVIENEMAHRTEDADGDFVTQPFLITTQSANTIVNEANSYVIVVDPGTAYVGGFKVETDTLFYQSEPKGITTKSLNPAPISIKYGNYLLVDNFAGHFNFGPGAPISLRDTSENFYSSSGNGVLTSNSTNIVPAGSEIGTARIRSVVYDNSPSAAIQSYANAVYRVYLFDILMNSGKSFANVAGIYSNNEVFQGIADVTAAVGTTQLQTPTNNQLIFPIGVDAIANVSNIVYTYRTTKTVNANTTGGILVNSGTDENFLNDSNFYYNTTLVPQANLIAANASGNVTSSVNTTLTGIGTTFTTDFKTGDFILLREGANADVRQVVYIANDTVAQVDANTIFTSSNMKAALILPHNVPVNLLRTGRSAVVTNTTITVILANSFASAANCTLTYSAFTGLDSPTAKTINRNIFVKLDMSNNAGGIAGPWILGISDVVRLKNVYRGYSTANTDITSNFIIDAGQGKNIADTAKLYLVNNPSVTLGSGDKLLVQLDCFTTATPHGPFSVGSWTLNDSANLASLTSAINTLEIPEVYDGDAYFDLRDCLDFRPIVANTANLSTSNTNATTNPVAATAAIKFGNTADPSQDKRFPYPTSTANAAINYYLGRKDLVTINSNGDFQVILGKADILTKATVPQTPRNALPINVIDVPPYPSIPLALSSDMATIADTKVLSGGKFTGTRKNDFTIQIEVGNSNTISLQPSVYTMKDIGTLEERIKNLEAMVLINELNNSIQNQESGIVYGFFADDFSTYDFADQSNPSYNASIVNNELQPKTTQLNLPFRFANPAGQYATLPWTDVPIVSQLNATDGCSGNNTSSQQAIQEFAGVSPTNPKYVSIVKVGATKFKEAVWDTFNFIASNTSGPVKLVMNGLPVPDKFYIFQHNTPTLPVDSRATSSNVDHNNPLATGVWSPSLVTTSDAAVNCTAAELAVIGKRTLFTAGDAGVTGTFPNQINFKLKSMPSWIGGTGIIYTGKVEWTHNPILGNYYTIIVVKGSEQYNFYFYYPADQAETQVCSDENQPIPSDFHGIMKSSPTKYKIRLITESDDDQYKHKYNKKTGGRITPKKLSKTDAVKLVEVGLDQTFLITCQGLKPNTVHNFSFGGVDVTSVCRQLGKKLGVGLQTNKYGQIQFHYHHKKALQTLVVTTLVAYEQAKSMLTSYKLAQLTSVDGSSYAEFTINSSLVQCLGSWGHIWPGKV